jgi:hypothetical protein
MIIDSLEAASEETMQLRGLIKDQRRIYKTLRAAKKTLLQ